ncbi:neurotrophin 1 [Caerostris extrusa]|uniref:Neurotrophin 1 n=1 Tax=Caerostris extrusa TaxID=172846 RepID=A0AAV4MMV9_CAEEX|nr:neurotrophin 1 [Caerostris extrusa]
MFVYIQAGLDLPWFIIGICLLCVCINAQGIRPQYHTTRRRKLPTVIITREHLRQRPVLYGPQGDTAAEFIVSAGLDNRQSSAVRIRKLGNNATVPSAPDSNPTRIGNSNGQDSSGRRDIVNFNTNIAGERRQGPVYPQPIHRRQDLLNERKIRPTNICTLFYQQPRNGHEVRPVPSRDPSVNIPNERRPSVSEGYDTEYRSAIKPVEKVPQDTKKDSVKNTPIASYPQEDSSNNPDAAQGDVNPKTNKEVQKEEDIKSSVARKNIVAETPVLKLKPNDAKNLIIRRPSLVLRDQITVNEVNETPDRPRFGPRALRYDEESSGTSRRKREADSDAQLKRFSHFHSKRLTQDTDEEDTGGLDLIMILQMKQ